MSLAPSAPARRQTRTIRLGRYFLGHAHPVRVQSMTNTDTRDALTTARQIERLLAGGCEIVRLAVPDEAAARTLAAIKGDFPDVPLVADIHFDHRLALAAIDAGFEGLRINPGNILGPSADLAESADAKLDELARAILAADVCVRVGVNSGSVEKQLLKKYGGPTPQAMVESALHHTRMLEDRGVTNIKVSLKSSSVPNTIEAYRLMGAQSDYPLHIGITEAGTPARGAVKSGVGLGILLYLGLGDTLRVSLTGPPETELPVAWEILRSLHVRERGPTLISCPTCGRTEIGLIELAEAVDARLAGVDEVFAVAVMGCVVNGPGEAREADIGVAGGRDCGVIFRKGEVVRKVRGDENLLPAFMDELEKFITERRSLARGED